jgi:hypothetical protein
MAKQSEFHAELPVRDVIARLLGMTLPAELASAAAGLIDRVAEHPEVARQMDKRWGNLSDVERSVIAREVGLVAFDIKHGAGDRGKPGNEPLN